MFVRPLWILVTSLILQGFEPKEVLGLRNVSLRMIPTAVQRGEHASLICQYDLEGEPLYSVKWYRGRHEFYRYSPSEQPVTKIFPYPGIHVDLSSSNESLVVLRKVGFNLSGNFSCEVTVDAPPFSTKTVTEQLQVVALPENPPTIMTEKERYDPGERLLANCTSPASKPAASLSFLLNDVPGVAASATDAQSSHAQQHPSAPAAAADLRAAMRDVQTRAAQLARELDAARAELSAQRAQLELLREEVAARSDALEQRLKRNALRIFGLAERAGEGSEDAVVRLARRLGVKLRKEDIDRSGRSGPRNGGEPRPLTVNFVSYKKKEQLLHVRRKLQNTGIDIVEDLTRTRTDLMARCVTKFGPRNVWTSEGSVFVKHHRLAKRIATVKDFENME